MVEVILDTNVLMLPFNKKIDIYKLMAEQLEESHQLIVLEPCFHELESLSKTAALLAQQHVRIVPAMGGADDAIVQYSKQHGALVLTQDRELRERLKVLKVRVGCFTRGKLRL